MYKRMNAEEARNSSEFFSRRVSFTDDVYRMIDVKTKEGKFSINLIIKNEDRRDIDTAIKELREDGYNTFLETKEDDLIFIYYRLEISW